MVGITIEPHRKFVVSLMQDFRLKKRLRWQEWEDENGNTCFLFSLFKTEVERLSADTVIVCCDGAKIVSWQIYRRKS